MPWLSGGTRKTAGYNIVTDRGDVRRTLDKSEGEKL